MTEPLPESERDGTEACGPVPSPVRRWRWPRWRLRVFGAPGRWLNLTDTPRRRCRECSGLGEVLIREEDDQVHHFMCGCWDPRRCCRLVRLPRWWPRSMRPPF